MIAARGRRLLAGRCRTSGPIFAAALVFPAEALSVGATGPTSAASPAVATGPVSAAEFVFATRVPYSTATWRSRRRHESPSKQAW